MLHGLRELSPSPIIFVEYERRRYFNWFVVEMEEDSHVGLRFAPPVSEVDLICRISHGRSAYNRTNTKKPGGESVSRLGRKAPSDPVPDGLLTCHDASIVSK